MIKKSIVLHIILGSFLFLGISSCGNQDVDLSGIDIDLKIDRFEQSLFSARSVEEVYGLKEKFPVFYPVYLVNIMPQDYANMTRTEQDMAAMLYGYISHPDMYALYELVEKKYGDIEGLRKELELLSKRINYYFPEEKIEQAITFVSTFEYASVFLDDDKVFAIGLDMYMGRDFEIYDYLDPSRFPNYRIRKFEEQYIVPNAAQSFLNYKTPRPSGNTFVDEAIYEGKKLYAMDKLLPRHEDSLKIGYARGMLEWCEASEEQMWAYFIDKELLFSTDKNTYNRAFFNDAPFTSPFGNESAPRTGAYVGWQIVRSYMDRHPEVTLADLLANNDHQKIFSESKYKP